MSDTTPVSKLTAAIAALDETYEQAVQEMLSVMNSGSDDADNDTPEQIEAHWRRLKLITKPFPLVDNYKGMAYHTIQPRSWAGTITNPMGAYGRGEGTGSKKSVYYDEDGYGFGSKIAEKD